ncbi:hypothetical protein [Segatella copri]|uniref:Uncharacterized protein n=2 Tax=Segatella copri TaxID=165179 RepID=A0AAW5I581_9BACT|nr:hypothetical protein [Segatella copri]MCP9458812.1 hypothetical protein [Segatella copri]MCP9501758.1 hypothetical protein [Segatella copri]MCP9504543.1 hypothetical protein [Segatella copri]MCP9596919.1 hypothetical protein [Segatella copri]
MADELQISFDFLGGFKEKTYFCDKSYINQIIGDKIMALAINGIPMLTGDEALAFREKAEETLKKRGSIDFSKQRAEMKTILAKAKF